MSAITNRQADVLAHTALNGRYVTGEADVIAMGPAGLLRDHGPQQIAGGMHYLTITERGRDALRDWRAVQPPAPKPRRRRRRAAFEAWTTYCEAFCRIPFREFLDEVWPTRGDYV